MPPHILAETWLQRHEDPITAVLSVVLALGLAVLVDRVIMHNTVALASRVGTAPFSAQLDTRVRFMRRMVKATIIVIGVSVALSQFAALGNLASAVLASGAIAAAVVGFAARQVLANGIAGMQLAITQPLRVGDRVTFEGETGTVEDIRLTATWLRTPDDARLIVPNERLAAGILRNESIQSATIAVEASVWIASGADVPQVVDEVRAALPQVTVRIAESTAEGTRLLVIGSPVDPAGRAAAETEIRETALRTLRASLPRPD